MDKKLSIQTETVEIKVVKVGGHTMTITTFRQIPYAGFNSLSMKDGDTVLGFVSPAVSCPVTMMDGRREHPAPGWYWLLCVVDGVLCRVDHKERLNCLDSYGKDPVMREQLYIAT